LKIEFSQAKDIMGNKFPAFSLKKQEKKRQIFSFCVKTGRKATAQ
jgi:hypothetical protein